MKILILCTGNSCRSQMAAAFLEAFDDNLEVYSAGTLPSERVHPEAIQVMKEIGVDIATKSPTAVTEFIHHKFDYVITVCDGAKEACPVFTGEVKNRLHIGFIDPAEAHGTPEEIRSVFRQVRNEILVDFFAFYRIELL